jgi:NOL1/NOP2/fmu family ribosome biogenesis protein
MEKVCPQGNDVEGDLIAIADGQTIVAIAKPLEKAHKISDMGIRLSRFDSKRLHFDSQQNEIIGSRVRLMALEAGQKINYKFPGRFCKIQEDDVSNDIRNLWEKLNLDVNASKFKIEARTQTLRGLIEDSEVKQYIIPIFQRPYAWGPREIEKFVGDVIRATQKNEPIFVGTIQLSDKHLLSPRGYYFQEVIDGQQRLTTCALILKVLLEIEPNDQCIKAFVREFDWLESRVSNGEQQKLLDDAIRSEISEKTSNGNNTYIDNCYQVKKILESHCEPKNIQNSEDDDEDI